MLADEGTVQVVSGGFRSDIQLKATSRLALINFLADELPKWRDRSDRPAASAETTLTSQLCAHMNGVSRLSGGWDFLQFRVEEQDEAKKGRKMDLIAAPSGANIVIDGRRHTEFDTLLPIECKRLPTPVGKDRDEREYVISEFSTTGGIHRFKTGNHGAGHLVAGMIAYVQESDIPTWLERVAGWIDGLAATGTPGWGANDLPVLETHDPQQRTGKLLSAHVRSGSLADITLHHLWIEIQ
ncbi:hypothetical protein RMR10_025200 (plasmid) [Agrobacterium rosae]|uniref:hypothetical protein n=1 Tax=Agrobacterium rosae TaxID=1972867 RepID=UPI002A0F60C4|nr:hypothetical protein [Agrobacterium rosae]MDX8316106.1 hypothetical protein [Agrobacterium rosae]